MFEFFKKKSDEGEKQVECVETNLNDSTDDVVQKVIEKAEAKEKIIQEIVENTGWSRYSTLEALKDAKKRMGISYKTYAKYKFYNIPVENQQRKYNEILEMKELRKARKEKKAKKNEKLINSVMKSTGWTYEIAKATMDKSKELTGAEYKDYVAYKFWELNDETQKTYFTKGCANILRKKYNTNEENVSCFMNKNEFNEVFRECLGREWMYNQDTSLDEFKAKFGQVAKIIYKPLSASCGAGVTAFELNEGNMAAVFEQLKTLPIGVVEGYLIQHKDMSKYSKKSVNTIRLVTVYANEEVNLLYAAFRMGGGDSVVDNFHSGGVLAIIDVKTGEVVTNAIDLKGKVYEEHPATHEKIKGFVIPYWPEIVALVKKAGQIVEGIGYVGWDIAVTEEGPVLIEGNTAPAPNVLQLPYAIERKGMRHVVEKYL